MLSNKPMARSCRRPRDCGDKIHGQQDVLERREGLNQFEELKNDTDGRAAKPRQAIFAQSVECTPSTVTVPEVGLSTPDIRLSSVDFPDPDAPVTATNSPASRVSDKGRNAMVSTAPCYRCDRLPVERLWAA
jgi:hypothetical protein